LLKAGGLRVKFFTSRKGSAIFSAILIDKLGWYMPDEAKYIIGAVLSGLICYIVWLKKQQKK